MLSDEAQAELRDRIGTISLISVDSIRPDPGQPRRLLPPDLSDAVASGEMRPADAIKAWEERVRKSEEGDALAEDVRFQNWQELQQLAGSIEQHGLINPITVRPRQKDEHLPDEIRQVIVTGERRYWAQVLLSIRGGQIQAGEEEARDPEKIKAIVSPEGITVRAHQLIENLQREDINAVEKAAGLLALRYELSGVTHGSPSSFEEDNGADLVPWARVEEAMGISKRHRIRLTSILDLSPGAQGIAAEHNLTERALRPIVSKLKELPGLQVQALTHLVDLQEQSEGEDDLDRPVSALLDEFIEELLAETKAGDEPAKKAAGTQEADKAVVESARFEKRVQGTLRFLERMGEEELSGLAQSLPDERRTQVVESLRQLRKRIDAVLKALAS
jgi:ParB-like chromosome segregation protein Spo0J